MRVFLAYPFTKLISDKEGVIDNKNKNFILSAIKKMKENDNDVFSAQYREAFGENLMEADIATKLDFEQMSATDLVVAFPGQFPISGGVHVELGWASALNKSIVIFMHKDENYSPMVEGLHMLTNVKYVEFDGNDSNEDMVDKIVKEVEMHKDMNYELSW